MPVRMRSKIKSIFSPKLLERLAAICDTNMIENNQLKMDLAQRLVNREGIKTSVLGGATNRYVFAIEGYTVKIALDDQGYKDNLMEYSLTREMRHTQGSYETNGYILTQELGRNLTVEEWMLRKHDILRNLDDLGSDYLLGDVGYYDINTTNWVISDDGEVRICDYAYCHRRTEQLFTCPICGSVLAWDEYFVNVLCTNRADCHAKFTYNDIKAIQGDAVDWEMINEVLEDSIVIHEGETFVDVDVNDGDAAGDHVFVIKSYRDKYLYEQLVKEGENMVATNYSNPEVTALLRQLLMARAVGDKPKISEIEDVLDNMEKPIVPTIKCVVDPEFKERMERDRLANEEAKLYNAEDKHDDYEGHSISDLIAMARQAKGLDNTEDEPDDEPEYYDDDEPDASVDDNNVGGDEDDAEEDCDTVSTYDGKMLDEGVVMNGVPLKEVVNANIEQGQEGEHGGD